MPRATSIRDKVRLDLTSVPEGWVDLRRMDFGEVLSAEENSYEAVGGLREGAEGNGKPRDRRKPREAEDIDLRLRLSRSKSTAKMFSSCIVDHNLEDESGRKLDFSNPKDVFDLDVKVASEIEDAITTLNEGGSLGNSNSTSGASSNPV